MTASDQSDPADRLLDAAEQAGTLKPLDAALKAEGASISSRDFMKFAQFDSRLKAKTPEELVQMLSDDPSIIQDVMDVQEKQESSEPGAEPGAEPPPAKQSADEMMRSRMAKARSDEMPQ